MPLPANGTPWPPQQLRTVQGKYTEWAAWYSGDPERLAQAYQRAAVIRPLLRPSQFQGGFVGSIARFFWGVPNNTNMPKQKLHVPVAGDLCQASGDLLYSEAPTLTVDGANPLTDRLEELVDESMMTTLAESAEVGAAFGDSYLRTTWDREVVPDAPFLTVVHADAAWPEFRWGRLTAVTFWHVVHVDGQRIWRHLERHELDSQGFGVIVHGLYEGEQTNLGHAVALTEMPATASIVLNDDGVISTESPGLAVQHVPNQRPQRRWREDPLASNFGRSDLDGVEGLMDQLDEVYNSWMRDVRLGKARLLVSQQSLENLDPGQGQAFDTDREIFTPLNTPPGSFNEAATGTAGIAQATQFTIRFAEHKATADELLEKIIRTAGYSTATFGEAGDIAMTATEVQARQQRTFMTRDRKIRNNKPPVAAVLTKLLAVDAALFNGPGSGDVEVEFPDGVQESMLTLAQTALALTQAQAASTETLVTMVHPDWDDERIQKEVDGITAEKAAAMPDPTQFFPANNDGSVGSQDAGQP